MGVLSAAERARLPKPHGRPAVWQVLRENRGSPLTRREIEERVNHGVGRRSQTDESSVRQYLRGLALAGYVRVGERPQAGVGGGKVKTYELIRDAGPQHPKVSRDGKVGDGSKTNGRTRLWQVMQVLGEFDVVQLSMTAQVAQETALEYARYLQRAGYIARINEPGERPRWRMKKSRWTGPRAPIITSVKALYDPNLREVVYARHGAEREGSNDA